MMICSALRMSDNSWTNRSCGVCIGICVESLIAAFLRVVKNDPPTCLGASGHISARHVPAGHSPLVRIKVDGPSGQRLPAGSAVLVVPNGLERRPQEVIQHVGLLSE